MFISSRRPKKLTWRRSSSSAPRPIPSPSGRVAGDKRLRQGEGAVGVRARLAHEAVGLARVLPKLDNPAGQAVELDEPLSAHPRQGLIGGALEEQSRRRVDSLAPLENVGRARLLLAGQVAEGGQVVG